MQTKKDLINYSVSLEFEDITLPPVKDIMILGSRCPQGKIGVAKCFQLMAPDNFDLIEVDDEVVQAILVNKRILKRISEENIINILRQNVFPYITNGEIVKVNINIKMQINGIELSLEQNIEG